jgi:hypothetical protein
MTSSAPIPLRRVAPELRLPQLRPLYERTVFAMFQL